MPNSKKINEFKVPLGPQHPALKEPESFSVALKGEKILGVDIRLGYNHRGVEKACEERTYLQDVYLIERVCGICSQAHSTCFVQAVEEIAGIEVPKRALYMRTLVAELERIHSHLLWLGVSHWPVWLITRPGRVCCRGLDLVFARNLLDSTSLRAV